MSAAPVVIVFGVDTPTGAAAALLLAQAGAKLVIGGGAAAATQAASLAGAGHEVLYVAADPLRGAEVERLVAQAVARFGRVSALYCHVEAAREGEGTPTEIDPARFKALIDANLKGVFHAVKYSLPQLARCAGALVLSAAPPAASGAASAFECSIAGLTTFMKCVAYQYGPQGVRANAIVPRASLCDGVVVDPFEAARLALFLLSDDASFITGTAMTAGGAPSPWPAW